MRKFIIGHKAILDFLGMYKNTHTNTTTLTTVLALVHIELSRTTT